MRNPRLFVSLCAGALIALPPVARADDPAPVANVATAATAATAATPQATAQRIALRAALEEKVAFHGTLNYDQAGSGAGNMMYPAPGLAGLLVAIAVHAAISNSARDAEKQKMRDQADLILAPHKALLGSYRHADLLRDAVPMITSSNQMRVLENQIAGGAGEVLVDSVPTFFMTQDRRALVLETAIAVRRPDHGKAYETLIRVISPATEVDTGASVWFDNEAVKLKAASARMFAQSVDLAIQESRAAPGGPEVFKTVRYNEGGDERMERAQILSSDCARLVLRTLRGQLLVVPRRTSDAAADAACQSVQSVQSVQSG